MYCFQLYFYPYNTWRKYLKQTALPDNNKYSRNKNRENQDSWRFTWTQNLEQDFSTWKYIHDAAKLSNPNSIPSASKIRHLARITVNRAHRASLISRKIDLPNNIPILIDPPFESPTFPTEGFHIHDTLEGPKVRGGEGGEGSTARVHRIRDRFSSNTCAHAWLSPLGGGQRWIKKKKFRSRHRFVFDPFRLPPNGARLNGLPASWTSSRDTDHRGAFRSWWPGSSPPPCDCFDTRLVNPFFPLSLSSLSSRLILFFLSSDEEFL